MLIETMDKKTIDLADLGWSAHFQAQLELTDLETTTPVRVLAVHRGMIDVAGPAFAGEIPTALLWDGNDEGRATVGDWLLLDRSSRRPVRLPGAQEPVQA